MLEKRRNSGFTLVEIAIVVTIIGLLLAVMFKGQSMIRAGQVLDTIAIAKDISTANQEFKQRYHYLPGDFPVDPANPEVTVLTGDCVPAGANKGDGNGLISATEALCVPAHLILAGLIKGDPTQPITSRYGAVAVISRTNSHVTGLPASIQNVIEFSNIPCDVAQEIDAKLDNGDVATGNIQSDTACTADHPLVYLAMPL